MRMLTLPLLLGVAAACAAEPELTIYNQHFAVVRERVALDLKPGVNRLRVTDTTAHLEPDSVILRDPTGAVPLRILEQNYRADPVSQELLLSLHEGQTIDFLIREPSQPNRVVPGRIIRSGYTRHSPAALGRYGQEYYQTQMAMSSGGGAGQPIIEVGGKLQFGLPGQPQFPALADDTILKPMLEWQIETGQAGKFDAELSYVTGGMSWAADYNAVAPEQGEQVDLIGWVTMDNQSGKTFTGARLQLLAGDVSKLPTAEARGRASAMSAMADAAAGPVSTKAFDEYHLYTIDRATTLDDRASKQVEFVRATGVKAARIYVYDGVQIDAQRWRGSSMESIRDNAEYGTQSNPKVWVMREFQNSAANQLGLPLPRGRVRFYRKDDAGRLQFTGENVIDHTPKDETLRIYTGNAFDLIGSRRRTDYKTDRSNHWADESFEIKLRNHKKEPVEIRVVEHLYRATDWEIREPSNSFLKTDAQTVEFRIPLKPDQERTLTYTAHYSW